MKKTAVLIPCFNEERTIAGVVRDMRAALPGAEVYVYDNNSTDMTAEEARRAGAIVRREPRQGKGHVMRSMLRDIDADVYVMIDGDGTYPAQKAPELVAPVLEGRADMVNGSRLHAGSRSSFRAVNLLGNRLFLALINRIFGQGITDLLTGYRAFNRHVASLPLFSGGFDMETELTLKAMEHNFRIAEVAVDLAQRPEGSSSKIHILRDGSLILKSIFSIMRDYKPLTSFGLIAMACFALAAAAGLLGWSVSIPTKDISLPAPVLASFAVFLGICSAMIGIILHSISRRFQELEMQMRSYMINKHGRD